MSEEYRELSKEEERAFILELTELTKKHKIKISGCGCCDSPSLYDAEITSEQSGYSYDRFLQWIDPSDEYDWEKLSKYIIK